MDWMPLRSAPPKNAPNNRPEPPQVTLPMIPTRRNAEQCHPYNKTNANNRSPHRGSPLYALPGPTLLLPPILAFDPDPDPAWAWVAVAAAGAGPRAMSSPRPRSRQAGSRTFCVARCTPNAACWSGTTSSSSSGLTGCRLGGTKMSSAGSLSLQKSSKRSACADECMCTYV
ncbi:hypothetical protein VTK26DRAFT_6159 [Humicola hyalothermophila]